MPGLEASPQLQKALTILHYVYPLFTGVYFFIAILVSICTLQTLSLRINDQHVRRDVILGLMIALVLEYAAQAVLVIIRTFTPTGWAVSEDEIVYLISSAIVWGVQVLALMDAKFPVWYPYYVNWVTGLLFEITFIAIPFFSGSSMAAFDYMTVSVQATRLFNLIVLIIFYAFLRNSGESYENDDAEQQSLLRKRLAPKPFSSEEPNQDTSGYGTADTQTAENSDSKSVEEDSDIEEQQKIRKRFEKRLKNDGNWWTYARGFAIFIPYVWPVHSKALQVRALLVGFCILATNALNVLVPRQLGAVTDALVSGDARNAWWQVMVYATLTFANSGACLGWLKFWLWLPLQQYSYDALNVAAQSHVMNLSSDFHDSKEASDIHQAVFQGRSITGLVDTICFSVLPMFVDLLLVGVYLFFLFGPYMMLDLLATTLFYIYTTTKLVSMAQERRRAYITHYRKEWTSAYSCIDNWRISTYFNNIPYEKGRYAQNIKNHMKSESVYRFASRFVSAAQGLILALGLLGGCFLAVYQVMHKIRSPGDFVVLLTYWAQLGGPLYFFSNMYKDISESMMDAERLLELFQTHPSIVDHKDAKPLKLGKGEIKFESVGYHYDASKHTLKNLDFTIPGGSTVAIVGETGGGKSTILKLINRLYDVTSGCISIDGQDVRKVTLPSLRKVIGVVPQDPTLFNDSIMDNVRYARLTASDSEVYEACKAAAIHDKIMSFPNGYNSKVGKRGIKLSGGEQQRIAIARAILKQPEIILLDEATSAVDTETERLIYLALKELCVGRTTVTVAHRLSTILSADCIMVLKNGEIIEAGTHEELICMNGKYSDLWSKQIDIKSAGGRSRSKSSKVNIINDLPPERQATELAKISRNTEGPGMRSLIQEAKTDTNEKLKPHAPEFVPHHLQVSASGSGKSGTKQERECLRKEKDQKKQQEREERRAYYSVARRAAKKAGKRVDRSEDPKESVEDVAQSGDSWNSEGQVCFSPTAEEKDDKPRLRQPRHCSRRHQSKSEPASHMQGSVDGTQDSDTTAISSSEGQPLVTPASQIQRRRISAPSDPPSAPHNKMFSAQGRFRRKRHWRMKNRAEDSVGSSTVPETVSSLSRSSVDSAVPNAPTTSPAEGVQAAGVRFAPGS